MKLSLFGTLCLLGVAAARPVVSNAVSGDSQAIASLRHALDARRELLLALQRYISGHGGSTEPFREEAAAYYGTMTLPIWLWDRNNTDTFTNETLDTIRPLFQATDKTLALTIEAFIDAMPFVAAHGECRLGYGYLEDLYVATDAFNLGFASLYPPEAKSEMQDRKIATQKGLAKALKAFSPEGCQTPDSVEQEEVNNGWRSMDKTKLLVTRDAASPAPTMPVARAALKVPSVPKNPKIPKIPSVPKPKATKPKNLKQPKLPDLFADNDNYAPAESTPTPTPIEWDTPSPWTNGGPLGTPPVTVHATTTTPVAAATTTFTSLVVVTSEAPVVSTETETITGSTTYTHTPTISSSTFTTTVASVLTSTPTTTGNNKHADDDDDDDDDDDENGADSTFPRGERTRVASTMALMVAAGACLFILG